MLTHETGHLFGIRHCIHYECLMCGCNHREEFDRRPIHLCPVCLRKLCIRREKPHTIDPVARYKAMAELAHKFGWTDEVAWLHRRIEAIADDASAPSAAAPKVETVSAAQPRRQRRTVVARPAYRLCSNASNARAGTDTDTKVGPPPPSVQLARQRSLERRLAQQRKTHATTSGLELTTTSTVPKKTTSRPRARRTVVNQIKTGSARRDHRTNRVRESKPRARRTVVRKPRRGRQVAPPEQDPVPPAPSTRVHLARQRSWDRREDERRAIARAKEEMQAKMLSETKHEHVNDLVDTKDFIFFYDEPYEIID